MASYNTKAVIVPLLCLLTFVFLIIISCNKKSLSDEDSLQAKSEFDPCPCAASTKNDVDEYIKAELNGVSICFDQNAYLGDTFPNMLQYGYILRDTGRQYYDNLYMIRNAANSSWQFALYFENTHALTKVYPYQLPRDNPEYCEIGSIQINDLTNYIGCSWCPENKFNYYGMFVPHELNLVVEKFQDDIFEGRFEGIARTGSGKRVTIKNGRFRIKLKVYQRDLVIR
jgi:hypothetical protein